MGDVAARINFIRNRKKELAKSRKEGAPDGNALPSKEPSADDLQIYKYSSWSDGHHTVTSARGISIDKGRILRTDPKLAVFLDKSRNTRLKHEKKITWFEKFKRIHSRKFASPQYEFSKPKNSEFTEFKTLRGYKQMGKPERLRYLKFFGRLLLKCNPYNNVL
jgi:hypothetical protein